MLTVAHWAPSRTGPRLRAAAEAPVDIASLVLCRIAFGLLMLWEVVRFFSNDRIGRYFIEPPFNFTFFGWGWVQPWPGAGMYWQFLGMGLLALCLILGLAYRVTAPLWALSWTYVFLLEQARYFNHEYLICLLGWLLVVLPAHRAWSLDARWGWCVPSQRVPAWCLWILRFQLACVYFFAGLAKVTDREWMLGWPLWDQFEDRRAHALIGETILVRHTTAVLGAWAAAAIDLLVVPGLLWRRSRPYAFGVAVLFHLTNELIYSIGIFPYLGISMTTIFLDPSWPRRFLAWPPPQGPEVRCPVCPVYVGSLLVLFCAWQVFMPLRHWLYPGPVNWTQEGHLYAWRMKLSGRSGDVIFYVVQAESGDMYEVDPAWYLTSRQLGKLGGRPDLIHQFALFLGERYDPDRQGGWAVYAASVASWNDRPRHPLVDSAADLLTAERGIRPRTYVLPAPTLDWPPPAYTLAEPP